MAPDLLSTIRAEIAERLDGLRPLLAEHERLLDAAAALEARRPEGKREGRSTNGTARRARRAGRPAVVEIPDRDLDSAEPLSETAPKVARRRSAGPASGRPPRAVRGAAREAILAALEHGSHTVGELAVVTAMSSPNINGNLRRLAAEGVVVKTERESKAAWALAEPVA
jgi:DNA-binding transcriptional ArsR family regulator